MPYLHYVQRSNRLYGQYKRKTSPNGSLQGACHHDAIMMS